MTAKEDIHVTVVAVVTTVTDEEIGLSKSNTPPSSNRFFHFPTGTHPITREGFGHTLAGSQSGAIHVGTKLKTGLVSLGTKKIFDSHLGRRRATR